ncbi:hypothetical protein B0H65DRAFT_144728 [Neurospora tetraspora]|uniref:Uncharacterized protein n=1 Tax=Neurospora tetraspora TaxID=94610 RepID=A0AAE0MWG9_9PEZI|nr:hypothetical protein B0H65DRAFT_144728 [Neurospora tetraspora]
MSVALSFGSAHIINSPCVQSILALTAVSYSWRADGTPPSRTKWYRQRMAAVGNTSVSWTYAALLATALALVRGLLRQSR